MKPKLTPFQLAARKALAEPYYGDDPVLHLLQQESVALLKEHEAEEAMSTELRGALGLRDALEADGFKCAVDANHSLNNECNWFAHRRTRLPSRECETNDGRPVQIGVTPFVFTHNGVTHESCSLDITGEANGIWFKLDAYSLPTTEAKTRLPEIEKMLVNAWNALTKDRPDAPT